MRPGVKIRAWLTQDQAVWDYALEVCRRVNGADLDVGHCLELIAGEFIATYAPPCLPVRRNRMR